LVFRQLELRDTTPFGIISKQEYSASEDYRPNFLMKPTLEEDSLPTKELPIFEPYYHNSK
jgi:hypothetical protein